jgi:calcineurin-like phosphoesterase family protein
VSEVFYTSDLHVGHEFVARTRGYETAAEHDEALITRWNDRVNKRDSVWVLGDVTGGSIPKGLEVLPRLNGIKNLVSGNHDKTHPLHRDAHRHLRRFMDAGWASVQTQAMHRIGGHRIMLSHFPYAGDHSRDGDRYNEWRLRDEGHPLLHGHVHTEWLFNGRQFNVGQDFAPALISQADVLAYFNGHELQ